MYYYESFDGTIARTNYDAEGVANRKEDDEPVVWEIFNEKEDSWEDFPRQFLLNYKMFEAVLIADQEKWQKKYE